MYILRYINIGLNFVVIFLLICCVLLNSCDFDDKKTTTNMDMCEKKTVEVERKLEESAKRVRNKNKDKDALIIIFRIAIGSNDKECSFSELSEVAGEILSEELLSDSEFWIKSVSELDLQNTEAFIKGGGLAYLKDDENDKVRSILLSKLESFKGNEKQVQLKKLIIDYLKE